MRIAHVGVEIVPSGGTAFVGGLVKNVATIAAHQATHGHAVDVVTTDLHGRRSGQGAYGTLHTVATRGRYGSLLFAGSFLRGAARELRRAGEDAPLDVIHVHSAYAALGVLGRRLRSIRAPKVFGLYSPNFRAVPGHDCNGSPAGGRIARRALSSFDAVAVPSESLANRARAAGIPSDRVLRIPPALDSSMLDGLPSRDDARRSLGLPLGVPVVAFVGNYSSWKGVEDLLRAMGMVHRRFPEALLLTAWGEPYAWSGNRRDAVMGLVAELGLRETIRQVGIVDDIRSIMRAANLLVSPFHCTCKVLDTPLSILEAMACERPVLGTKVGGVPEILDEARGVLVAPRDVEALSDGIEAILANSEEAEAIGRRAAQWVRGRFRPDAVARELDTLYTRLRSASS